MHSKLQQKKDEREQAKATALLTLNKVDVPITSSDSTHNVKPNDSSVQHDVTTDITF